jgi:hypothetical protein
MKINALILATWAVLAATQSWAATLGLQTSAPTIGANVAEVEYLDFAPDGDLSMFGAAVTEASLNTPGPNAEIGFGIGYALADPEGDASGGFDIFDDNGLYLAGDLINMGYRAFGGGSLIELHFGNLTGSGASGWTDTLLMNVILRNVAPNPFDSFFDGDLYQAEIGVFAVVNYEPPSEIPLPASAALLLVGVLGFAALGQRTNSKM